MLLKILENKKFYKENVFITEFMIQFSVQEVKLVE